MKLRLSTYRTLSGVKKIVEIPNKKATQWVICQDNVPKFFVDFYDIKNESNAIMNSLVLCAQKPINEVLERINKRNNIYLSIPKVSYFGIKVKSEYIKVELVSLPEKWLDYSL